ncbi:aromatic-ring-hydroxylating dioxygenase subunit beta [Corynebacterium felinum]|uniref:Biphenyl 2,3-dioxygenase beta subunit n=1 Tax=Corynebacterium felinum TaxID=131318 RepID=A0ABU2BA01_9CORY|nr:MULTISPECIES: aromatic-ring-hydroxylating dioxygenase subunit beta [Corynebacterium]MDF5820737.1 aromatic-ring-hydroxylating dioxygenase subunit beta [Corynebacterium felinum]MDO4761632.1 aromatic-ring-hydroxylating dioxygenase subunit beta [Corynebacterium sp.]MDR7354214.1 biphenyl 2,3-dioxygenase beta subunit [Corynebacterium felinum]WJY96383.1 Biphenyl dioxygenase subunit beta [Corynebacterium felinum]
MSHDHSLPEHIPHSPEEKPFPVALSKLQLKNRIAIDAHTERAITRFLYDEAELIDNMEWDDWLTCMHDDVYYWAPVRENRVARERKDEYYKQGTSVYFEESKEFLRQRVYRLQTNMAWAEEPPSRSRHMISNIRVDGREDGNFDVRSNFYIYRTRGERSQDAIAGERRDIIVHAPDAPFGWLILHREIRFDMSTILVKNLSLFY